MTFIRSALAALALAAPVAAAPIVATAQEPITREVEGSFDDIAAAVESAIVNAGLVIDSRSYVGDMLARTKEDVGGEKDIFTQADVFTFCSATVSREVMERDVQNLQFCPYSIFVYETPDAPNKVVIGHQDYAERGVPEINALLDPIMEEAASW